MEVIYPKVKSSADHRIFVEFYQNKKRYRLFNGSKINIEIYPNSYPIRRRIEIGNQLASEVYSLLTKGISIEMLKTSFHIKPNMSDIDYIKVALEKGKTYYWCACGQSKNQPFCDGSHKGSAFTPLAFTVEEPKEKMLCRCKKTSNAPYCDGSHTKL